MTRFLVRLAVTAGLAICGWLLGLAFSAAAMAAEPGMDEVGEAETDSTVLGGSLDGGVDKTTDLVSSTVEGVTSTTRQVTSSALETVNTTTAAVTDAAGVEPVQDTVETVTSTVDNTVGTVTDTVNDVVDTAEKTVDGTVGAVTGTVDAVTEPVRDAVPVPVESAPERVTKEQVPAKTPVGKTEKSARESAAKASGDDAERSRPREAARPEFRLAEVTQHADPATASGLEDDGHPGSPLPSAPGGVAATAVAGDSAAKKLGIVAVDPATTDLQRTGFGSTLPAAAVVAASALPCTSPD